MAFEYQPLPPPVQPINPLTGFTQGLTNSLGSVQQMQGQGMKNALMQEEITKRKDLKNALAGYGQGGFDQEAAIQKVMPIDPELAMKMQTIKRTATQDQLKTMAAGIDIWEKMGGGAINNPAQYHQTHQMLKGMGLDGIIPPVQTFIGPDGKIDMNKMNETINNTTIRKDYFKQQFEMANKPPTVKEMEVGDKKVQTQWNPTTKVWEPIPGMEGPRWDPNKPSLEVTTNPDGTVSVTQGAGGKGGTPSGLPTATVKDLYDKLLGATENLKGIQETTANLKPEYLEYMGQFRNWVNKQQEKLGGTLDEETQKKVEGFTNFIASAKSLHSKILKNLSGLAVTAAEEERIKSFTIDPDKDSGTTAKTKLKRLEEDTKAGIVRANYARIHGLSLKNVDQLDGELKKAVDAAKQAFKAKLSPDQRSKYKEEDIEASARKRVAEYYMLVY